MADALAVSLTDADLDANPASSETVQLTVANNLTGENEVVTLTETGAGTGVFTGALATTLGSSAGPDNDGVMNTGSGHMLTASYVDAMTASGGTVTGATQETDAYGEANGFTWTGNVGDYTIVVTDTDPRGGIILTSPIKVEI